MMVKKEERKRWRQARRMEMMKKAMVKKVGLPGNECKHFTEDVPDNEWQMM
jgi:hypothetical protein